MNPQVPDELISAYFDGEVTPEERVAVERFLAESEDAQRELNDTARLSALLHSFPRESAPVELAANILRQTERISLPVVTPAATPSTRQIGREWKAALMSAVTTAACLVMLWVAFDRSNVPQPGGQVAEHQMKSAPKAMSPAPVVATAEVAMSDAATDRAKLESFADTKAHDLPMESKQQMDDGAGTFDAAAKDVAVSAQRAAKSGTAPMPSLVEEEALKAQSDRRELARQPAMKPAMSNPINALGNPLVNANSLANFGMSNGDFVEQLRDDKLYRPALEEVDTDNNVAVVYVDVTDVERGGDTFYVALRKQSIQGHSLVDYQPDTDKADGKRDTQRKRAEPGQEIFYIRAYGKQLASVLEDANLHPDLVRGFTVQMPLEVATNEVQELSRSKGDAKKAESSADKNTKSIDGTVVSEVETEIAEANQVVQALIDRNGSLANNPVNPGLAGPQAAMTPYVANRARNSDYQAGQRFVQGANGSAEKAKTESVRAADEPAAMADRVSGNYFVRLPTGPSPIPAAYMVAQSRAMSINAQVPMGRSMAGGGNPVAAGSPVAPSPAFRGGSQPREAGGRPVRMLLVLQPSPVEPNSAPAPAEPAGKQDQQD